MKIKIAQSNKNNKNVLMPLIEKNKFNPYAGLGFYGNSKKLDNYYYDLFFSKTNRTIFLAEKDNIPVGLVSGFISSWDSRVFGIKIAKIEYITALGAYKDAIKIKKLLIKKILAYLKEKRVKHVSIRLNAQDFSSIHVLEDNGFRFMDNIATYIFRQKKIELPDVSRWFTISRIGKKDIIPAQQIIAESGIAGHYTNDPEISNFRVKRMYKKWLVDAIEDKKNNDVFIAKRAGVVVGCAIFSFNDLLYKHTGLQSLHRGLVAALPSAKGSFIAFTKAYLKKRKNLDFAEYDTQTYNYPMINVLQKLGMRFFRLRYTFHKTL
ncbi:MAG: hypothetical protein ABH952_11280 [Candidatus Omnitrophota bacterium]